MKGAPAGQGEQRRARDPGDSADEPTFDSLTGSAAATSSQVIDYMLNNNMLDIDK